MTLADPPPLRPREELPERVQRILRVYDAGKMRLYSRIANRMSEKARDA